ncbi:hypothetical protein SAHL_05025 [Salinisphaera orenii YIM 95161]|uniref:Uncharacterized protein n=2 Tax=Salinisphaera TaxID=180541 RepID=A0A423Q220_9GAMM|nr:hypothetical protein SAHL_05025 [Salinisphaera halophila YIM 95161]
MTVAERVALVGLLALMGFMTMPFAIAAEASSRLLLYGGFVAYLFALSVPFIFRQWTPGVFHPLVFYVVWVGIQGLLRGEMALPVTGLDYHRALSGSAALDLNALVAESFLLDAAALVFLYTGYLLAPNFRVPRLAVPVARWPAVKSIIWLGIAGLGVVMLATIGGGLDQVLMQRGIASDQRIGAQVGGQWGFLAGTGVVAPLVWLVCDRRAVRNPLFWAILAAALVIKFAATGSRGGAIVPLIIIGAVYVLQSRNIPYSVVLTGIIVALVLVGGLGQYRQATMDAENLGGVAVQGGPMQWMGQAVNEMEGGAGENNGQLAVLGKVPTQVPYLLGESYLSIPFVFVPSAVWGDKPDAAGKLNATRVYGNPLNAIPPKAVGEAYWNFSYVGVVFVFMLYGASLKALAAMFRANSNHPIILVLFVYVLFYLQPHTPSIYGFFHAAVPAVFILLSFLVRVDGRMRFQDPA